MHLYGALIALGLAIAAWLCTREEKRLSLPRDTGLDIVLHALPPAVVAARLYYVAFAWDRFRGDPVSILYVWEGGLAIYGAVIGGALGVLVLSRRRRISFAALADVVAPALLLGQAIGRWGNFFNGEAYGYAVGDPAWQFFPFAVQVAERWHLATFFYESLWNLLGFLFLYLNRDHFQRGPRRGHVFLWYLLWYGLGRLSIEGLRTDSLMWGSIRVSQWLSLVLCCLALAGMIRALKLPAPAYALPAAALALPFLLAGWAGIAASSLALVIAGVWTYASYPREGPIT